MATTYYGETDRTRGVLIYSTSETNTQVTITARTQLQAKNYSHSGYRVNTKFNGTTVSTDLDYVHSVYTSWTTAVDTGTYTSDPYTKTHSAQSVVIKSEYYGEGTGDYFAGGKSGSTSVTITIPAKPSYSISYNANGGSGAPSSQTKWYGETLTLQSGTPTRTNYLFKGWSTSSTATTATYSAGGSYTTNAAATLYAVWELNGYTISYNLNGGSGSFADQTKIHGQTLTLRTGSPTKASSSVGSYTVTYNANSGSVSPTSATASRTTSYTFSKWNTKQDGSGTNYNSGASYTANAAAVLYAQYTSSTSTASVKLPTPTRSNYTFTGWYTASSGGTKVGDAGANYTPTGTTTLYAHWTGVTYTITYNLNGGSGTFANQTKVYGTDLTLRSGSPTKAAASAGSYTITYNANGGSVSTASATAARTTSYTFSKWNTKQDGTGTNYYAPDHLTYSTNAAATLYAQYTSSTSTASVTLLTPTRTGYSFAGWYTAASGGTQKTSPFTPTSSTTLYAHWTANTYTISYDLKGGSGSFADQTKTQDVALPLRTGSPTKMDYVFKGWDTNSAGTTVVYSAGASYTANTSAILHAVWQLNYSEPKITNVSAVRSNSGGTAQDDGTYVKVKCNWRTFSSNYNATKIEIHYKTTSASSWTPGYTNDSPGAYSGTLTQTIGGSISTSDTYDIRIRVTDQVGRGSYTTFVSTAFVGFDQGTEGKSLGFGMVAYDTNIPTNGRLDVGMNTYWYGTNPMTVTSYGQASVNAAFKFSQSSTDSGISPAFMISAQTGSWSVGTRTDYDNLYFTYNDGGGTTNDNTFRFYLSSSEGTKNKSYKILTAAAPVPVANGGTGQTTASDAMNAFINSLSEGASNSTPDDYIITQYAGGGTTNTTYYRRKLSKVFASSISGLTVAQGGTGASTFTSGGLVTGNGTGALTAYTPAWQAWTAGTTAGPKAKIKLGNVNYESAAIPAASSSASGIVTTGNQTFAGRKTMDLISPSIYDGTSTSSRYKHIYFRNNAGTFVGEVEYDSGDATNVSGGTFWFTEMSPKSTADTATTGHYEAYGLPTVTTGRTTDASYRIITTKGGTMPARFSMYQSYQPYFVFKPTNSTNNGENTYGPASIWVNSGNSTYVNLNKMYFRLYSPSKDDSTTTTYTSYYDQFSLPGAETGRTSSGSYDILTTKNTVTIAQGGTGATTRLGALKALTNENVGTSAAHFLTITDSWGKGGYTSVANAKTVLGITGTQYGSNHMGWKKVSITMTNGAGSVACTGVTADSVVQVTRVGTYSDTSGGYSTHIGAAATNAGNVKVFSTASGTVTWNVYIWWSKTASGG